MKAVLLHEYGGPDRLRYEDTDVPDYGDNEVLVRMHATSINPIDYKVRSGTAKDRFPVEFPAILGRDLAGEVEAWGRDVTGFSKGMHVMALTTRTYAEYVVVKAEILSPIPDALTYEQAGALPLVTLTGTQLIERAVKPQPGQTVLVTGGLGSVGRTAVHTARKHGARVLAGVRRNELDEAKQRLQVDAIAIDDEDEVAKLRDLDAIADTVGGPTVQRLLHAVRSGGVLGSVLGKPQGADNYQIRVEAMMVIPDASRLYQLAEDLARGEFSIPVARVMKLSEIQEAHRLAERHESKGKIVLVP